MLAGAAILILGGGMSIGIYLSSRNSPAKTGKTISLSDWYFFMEASTGINADSTLGIVFP